MASLSHISCEKPEQVDIEGTLPVEPSKEVVDFFNENLPAAFTAVCPEIGVNQACIMVINEKEEFSNIFSAVQAPEIDFDKYTFIACLFEASAPKYAFMKQTVVEDSDKITLNILLEECQDCFYPAVQQDYYFWGLYEKLPEKPVTAHITVY